MIMIGNINIVQYPDEWTRSSSSNYPSHNKTSLIGKRERKKRSLEVTKYKAKRKLVSIFKPRGEDCG